MTISGSRAKPVRRMGDAERKRAERARKSAMKLPRGHGRSLADGVAYVCAGCGKEWGAEWPTPIHGSKAELWACINRSLGYNWRNPPAGHSVQQDPDDVAAAYSEEEWEGLTGDEQQRAKWRAQRAASRARGRAGAAKRKQAETQWEPAVPGGCWCGAPPEDHPDFKATSRFVQRHKKYRDRGPNCAGATAARRVQQRERNAVPGVREERNRKRRAKRVEETKTTAERVRTQMPEVF